MAAITDILFSEATAVSECLDGLAARKWQARPLSTYRLQLNRDLGFRQARELVGYLHALGVTHAYASPILQARSGSQHGYDIIDHNAINPDMGSEQDLEELCAELKRHRMGLVLDVVPNHMGVGTGTNPWWQDVLQNGRSSEYAEFFDVEWQPLREEMRGKVLLPILGGPYGEVLENGELTLVYESGRFGIVYHETRLPLDPHTVPLIIEPLREGRDPEFSMPTAPETAELQAIVNALGNLPPHTTDDPEEAEQRRREAPRLLDRLAALAQHSAAVREAIEHALRLCNGRAGDSRSFDALHRLLEAQPYRLAHWRVSAEEINYRRFFDINDLVGVRMEAPRVFAETHRLVRRLLAEGWIDGLRIDHPDGLLNPAQYFTRLQMVYAASQCAGAEPAGSVAENGVELEIQRAFSEHDWMGQLPPVFVAVEKILEAGEELPRNWAVDGTVGYDFLNLLNGIFIDKRHERAFTALYRRFTGWTMDVPTLIYLSKKLIMNSAMAGELMVLAHLLAQISSTERRARDFTRTALANAVRETIACFPVYRTYIDERGTITERDRGYINEAIARARRRNESMPAAVFHFLRDTLLLKRDPKDAADSHRRRLRFTLKFQQLTGPVMAKGLEDTACYVYNRFCTVNEVGGSPDLFGHGVEEFHRGNMMRAERWPSSMLTTSTHDTKRSEDVRARLNVLSEIPRAWASQALKWRRMNHAKKRVISDGRSVPDHNEEYLLYQTLLGVWPFVDQSHAGNGGKAPHEGHEGSQEEHEGRKKRRRREETGAPDPGHQETVRRVQQYMTKAVHEAKINLSWVNPNQEYVEALHEFIARILGTTRARSNGFVAQLEAFAAPVQFFGAINSLAQALLKMTAPGTPDFFQGTELWDFSMVDPDNRRPVDFGLRGQMLEELQGAVPGLSLACGRGGPPRDSRQVCAELLERWQDGGIKLWTTMRGLRFRRDHPELFRAGSYVPLQGLVEKQEHVVGFARVHKRETAIAAAPRFAYTLMRGEMRWPLGEAWGNAELALPPRAPAEFVNVLTGETLRATGARTLSCRELFACFPLALLSGR